MTALFQRKNKKLKASGDKNYCAPLAVSIALNMCPNKVNEEMLKVGRRFRKGTPMLVTEIVLAKFGKVLMPTNKFKAKTVTSLKKELPSRGVFIVRVSGHVLCARGGEIHDWSKDTRKRIMWIGRVKDINIAKGC